MAERKLRTSYREDMALFPDRVHRVWLAVGLVFMFSFTWWSRLLVKPDFALTVAASVVIAAIGALGLNLLSGFAGQVSLGHAFFLAVGTFVGATIATKESAAVTLSGIKFWAFGLPWPFAVLGAGIVAAIIGVIVGPTAVRLRGLYLSLVTLALLFLGDFLFKAKALEKLSGAARGRSVPDVTFPFFGLSEKEQFFMGTMIVGTILYFVGKNLARSRIGRAFQATRDRDIAAEVIGVNVTRAKIIAFGVSSFYAGAAGFLFGSLLGNPLAENFGGSAGLILSVEYVAMIVIGGIGTVLGAALGALFVQALPEFVKWFADKGWLPFVADTGQGSLNTDSLSLVLFGLFIVVFLVFEPFGLYGLWLRARNYWKGWPFSY